MPMDQKRAIAALGALAQDTRLDLFRLLVTCGPEGLPAGVIAQRLGVQPSSLSFHLAQLAHAGLITQRRLSRQLIYSAEYGAMNELLAYLTENCCGRGASCAGCGWNAEEMEDHGTVYETRTKKMREQVKAMKEIWTKDTPEYHGEIVDFPPMMARPKPVQKPHPPIIVGGAFRFAARRAIRYGDGILPAAPSAGSGSPEEFMPRFRKMAEEAGRDPASLSVTLGGAPEDIDVLKRNRDLGVTRMTVRLPPAKEDEILPMLDRWAKLIPQVRN